MLKTKVLPSNLMLSSLIAAAAMVFLYTIYSHNVPAKTAPIFYDEPVVVQKTSLVAVKTVAEVKPSTMPTIAIPPMLTAPKVISRVLPEFPSSVLGQGVQGTVLLSVYVGTSGIPEVVQIKASSGNEELDNSAAAAVKMWKFEPAKRGIQAIGSWFEVPVVFSIK
jgi:TonB family protein